MLVVGGIQLPIDSRIACLLRIFVARLLMRTIFGPNYSPKSYTNILEGETISVLSFAKQIHVILLYTKTTEL